MTARKPKKPQKPNYLQVPAAVYYLYGRHEGRDDVLLYIGVTRNIRARFAVHKSTKAWWPDVQRHEERWFDDRLEADKFEAEEIRSHLPVLNPIIPQTDRTRLIVRGGPALLGSYRQRNLNVLDEVWEPTLRTACARKENIVTVIDRLLRQYVAEHKSSINDAAA